MNNSISSKKVEMVVVGSLFQDIGWENPADVNKTEWIALENIGKVTHNHAWNDYDTAVRNTPEIVERVLSFWTTRLQQEVACPTNDYYTQEKKERCIAWTRLTIEQIKRQAAEEHNWILICVAFEDEAAIRATLA